MFFFNKISSTALSVVVVLSSATIANSKARQPDAFTIFNQFIYTQAVGKKCSRMEKSDLQKYLVNHLHLTQLIMSEMVKKQPLIPDEVNVKIFKKNVSQIERRAKKEVDRLGCDAPKIKKIIGLYHKHAELNMVAVRPSKMNVVEEHRQLLIALDTVKKCEKPNRDLLKKFQGKLDTQVGLMKALVQKQNPNVSKEEFMNVVSMIENKTSKLVDTQIGKIGCAHEKIGDMIIRFSKMANGDKTAIAK